MDNNTKLQQLKLRLLKIESELLEEISADIQIS